MHLYVTKSTLALLFAHPIPHCDFNQDLTDEG